MLVLDEPNSNLDNDGTMALNVAIRSLKAAGGSVIIMAHRPAAIQECDLLLVVEDGMRRAFGPRDQVLKRNGEKPHRYCPLCRTRRRIMSLLRKKPAPQGLTPAKDAKLPAKPAKTDLAAPITPPTPTEVQSLLSARKSVLIGSITAGILVFGFGLWSVATRNLRRHCRLGPAGGVAEPPDRAAPGWRRRRRNRGERGDKRSRRAIF